MAIYEMIRDLGFPIFISIYLLVRVENSIKELNSAIVDLTFTIKERSRA